ncbi:hypothetical protein [Fischerella thermalis]|jgi:aspartate ammonia-lyase|uniref:Uncharacterized protein n=2 Tax=Fischerella TaxID=1190 RepID=G6FUN3_9CYAN|nr:hypothetical protein [Fischerella thermalis]PLZ78820.1 hypothetical protein CBP16_17855 [Fischerella thermalis WC217]PMB07587.1 hypothetical protein CEN49_12335 [Fischerella thermalis CCMEE 5273]PMB40780.1 hypothetical protein CEN40_21505 [Fischerella thermalis CCMEE 5205]EHC12963.1 hypothetical protein FJSC11DRAFT_2580 [Fischerella thermalis JSC-11]MBF1989769.1 hypothetical protein [Fischerella thermalis M58_A2018_009]
MKKIKLLLIILVVASAFINNSVAKANNSRKLTIINKNKQIIVDAYIKSENSDKWEYAFDDIATMLMPGESTSIKVNPNQCIYNLSFRYINGSFGGFRVNTCQSSVLNVVGNGGTSWSHGQGRERDYIPGPQILMPDSGLSNGIFFPR